MKFVNINESLGFDTNKYDDQYIPIEVKKGSCVLLHGNFVHKSLKNFSEHPRDAYTLHIVDTYDDKWSELNWLQRKNGIFPDYFE